MTRVTNLVKRKRTYISDDIPANTLNDAQTSSTSKQPDHQSHSRSGGTSRKATSSASKHAGKDGKWAKHPKDKAAASEKRRVQRMDDRNADKTCFACRETGHTARECPNAVAVDEGKSTVGICYRCGSNYHTLARCRKPENKANPLPFAQCFVCSQKGHLAGACPSNMNGLYPNGGGCKVCGQNDHLAKDCPTRKAAPITAPILGIALHDAPDAGADEDDFHALKRRTNAVVREEEARSRIEKLARSSASRTRNDHNPSSSSSPASAFFSPGIARHAYDDPLVDSSSAILEPSSSSFLPSATSATGASSHTPHPDRQVLIAGGDRPRATTSIARTSSRPAAVIPATPARSQNDDRTFAQQGSAAPAFIPRGTAALPMRKTKIVSF